MGDTRSWLEGDVVFSSLRSDSETAQQIVDSLTTTGYRVDLAVDGNDGLRRGISADYAVITVRHQHL